MVSAAALRVADITRVLKSKTLRGVKGGDVAKLFAKHFKVDEQVQYLRRASIGAAVGTPGRLGKLLCDTGTRRSFASYPRNLADACILQMRWPLVRSHMLYWT